MTLDQLRTRIDEIDLQIKDLFLERMKTAEAIAESKSRTGDKILKPEREEEVIRNLTRDMSEEMKLPYTSFLKKVMEVSRTFQYRKLLALGADFKVDFQATDRNRIRMMFACPHRSGSLAAVLGIFEDYGVNLTGIHSRPDGKNPWEYLFYVDFTGNLKDERIRALLYQLYEELPFAKILGSYEDKSQQ